MKLKGELKNLILAMNLSLCRTCISDAALLFSSPRIQYKAADVKNEIEITGDVIHATSENVVIASDEVFAWTSSSEYIDAKYMLSLFRILQKLKSTEINQNPILTNLSKGITEYEKSMLENSRLFIFKHLFNSLELCINSSKEYISDDFDVAVSKNVAIPERSVRQWRKFYSRIKHVDRSKQESVAFENVLRMISSMILPVMRCSRKMIAKLLNSV
jgi:hypothetical protein